MMDWAEKYRPRHLGGIVGNRPAIRTIAEWARSWTHESKPLILYGKPGIGKTSTAHALANEMNWEIVELNASDQRTKAIIEKIAGSSSTTASLTGASRKLIILDEADNLHGTADRGGARAIIELIKYSRQPIILIANDLYGIPKELKSRCEPVQFRAIQARSIAPHLRDICASEEIACSKEGLVAIAESANGDLRAAVNILYAAAIGKEELDEDDIHTSQKDERATIFELINALFKGYDDRDLLKISYEVSDTPDTMLQWIAGNLYQIEDIPSLAKAYRNISRADEFIGFTFRRQYYTLWRYATALMLIGTADAASGKGLKGRILPPPHWKLMSRLKKQKAIRTSVLNKLSRQMHIPQNTLREDFLTPIGLLVEQDPVTCTEELELDKDELNFFLHDKERSAQIMKEVTKRQKESRVKNPANIKSIPAPKEDKKTSSAGKMNQSTLFDGF
jgi:replication factor C large subunit